MYYVTIFFNYSFINSSFLFVSIIFSQLNFQKNFANCIKHLTHLRPKLESALHSPAFNARVCVGMCVCTRPRLASAERTTTCSTHSALGTQLRFRSVTGRDGDDASRSEQDQPVFFEHKRIAIERKRSAKK